jgi:23S rRNA (guanosine2251-2'-O)-methyltransferase
MVERYKRGKGKQQLMGNHQKCWIWGRNLILETLKAGRWQIHDLWLGADLPSEQLDTVRTMARALDVPVHVADAEQLRAKCHSSEHQGYAARMTRFCYADTNRLDEILAASKSPLIVVCDSLQDPFNFGATIRSAEVMSIDAIVIGRSHQVGVTSMVARASAGAVNHLPIIRVESLPLTVACCKPALTVIGASEKSDSPLFQHDLTVPTAIVIGNEGQGISPGLLEQCDALVQIPQAGRIGSLNAAVSASIFFYEARRQRMQI